MTHLMLFGLSLVIALAATPLVRRAARRLAVVDRPDGFRKVQQRPVPRLGGVAIYLAFFGALLLACRLTGSPSQLDCGALRTLALGATAVLLIGLLDDVAGVRAGWKLLGLTAVGAAMYCAGWRIPAVSNPFGGSLELGPLALPVTLFWFLGCINGMNLIDGLDGLATGVAVLAGAAVFALSLLLGNAGAAMQCAALVGAGLGFLWFNFNPASIFLGDSGSYLLGFLIACLGLRGAQKSNMVVALLVPLIALGLPVMDTALAIVRRWSYALPLSASDRQHIHHKLLNAGLSHRQAVVMMYLGCIVLAAFGLMMTAVRDVKAAGLLFVLGAAMFVVLRAVGRSELHRAKVRLGGYLRRRRSIAGGRAAAYIALERMRQATSVESLWQVLTEAAGKMQLDLASLSFRGPHLVPLSGQATAGLPGQGRWHLQWRRAARRRRSGAGGAWWSVRFALVEGGTQYGELRAGKMIQGSSVAPDFADALELLCLGAEANLPRLCETVRPRFATAEALGGQAQPVAHAGGDVAEELQWP